MISRSPGGVISGPSRSLRSVPAAAALACAFLAAVAAQAPINLEERIPLDAAVRTATLGNGLQYFIRENAHPARRVSMRLAVKAGSMMEADDQRGTAHLIEHIAFTGRYTF